eukprot:TRINITY_DN22958_c0_g1_i1.p1 TRINITY_DN22958_c0_g1~~TRINITY_DN22958_c0_g1_i1.p1  ORF type:complete len:175 (+),score=35.82 TRINITY_DN22958_c0_g1_i1:38-526(+)
MIPSLFSSFTSTSTRASPGITNSHGNSNNNIIARFYHHRSAGGFQQQHPYRWGHSRMMHDAMMPPSSGHPHHPHHNPLPISEHYLQRGGPFYHYYRAMHAKRFMRTAFIVGVSMWIGYAWGKRNEKKSLKKKKHNNQHYDRKHDHEGGTTTTVLSTQSSVDE